MRPQPRSYIAGQRRADQQERRLEHEPQDQAERVGIELGDRAHPLDAGVVDEDVDVERQVVERRRVGEVDDPRLAADLGRGGGRGIRVEVGDDDVRAAAARTRARTRARCRSRRP